MSAPTGHDPLSDACFRKALPDYLSPHVPLIGLDDSEADADLDAEI
jgi:hypothetical protein